MNATLSEPFIAYTVQRFPALRTTFIRREVEALRKLGLPIKVFSMRPVDRAEVAGEPEAEAHVSTTNYLPDFPFDLFSIIANLSALLSRPRVCWRNIKLAFDDAGAAGFKPRVKLALQVWRGAVLARMLTGMGNCTRIHAQFADGAATTSLAAARLLGMPFSFMSHTSFDSPALRTKLREADFVASISEYDRQRLLKIEPGIDPQKIHVIHCGLPLEEWPFEPKEKWNDPPVLLSVGALIEKKGHDVLIDACKRLKDRGMDFRCRIVGAGPLRESLQAQIQRLDLQDRVMLLGPLPQKLVREELKQCDVFVLACKQAANGDTDGIPVSLMEAMAMGRPVVSCDVAGVGELLASGTAGQLCPPSHPDALAESLGAILTHTNRNESLAAGRKRISRDFDVGSQARLLAARLSKRHEPAVEDAP